MNDTVQNWKRIGPKPFATDAKLCKFFMDSLLVYWREMRVPTYKSEIIDADFC